MFKLMDLAACGLAYRTSLTHEGVVYALEPVIEVP